MANPDEQEQDAPLEGQGFSEEAFKAKLRKMGRLRQPTGKVPKPEGPFSPVQVKGKTLSESLIEERR
jgi:hypothetical protein